MSSAPSFRTRLPSAAAAIALQAGLFALLALSFTAVRQVTASKETILILPRLLPAATPQARKAPVVIDARPVLRTMPLPDEKATSAVIVPSVITAPTAPGNAIEVGPADCIPQGQARPATRIACPLPAPPAQSNDIPLHPPSEVKDEARWKSEMERRNTPPRIPCVSLTSNAVGYGGFNKEDHGARVDISCALKALRDGPEILPPINGAPAPDTTKHASSEDFAKALQAVNARKQALSAGSAAAGTTPP